MTKPLAFLIYENLLPGSQLVNRMQDLGYRVQTLSPAANLIEQAQQEKPLLMLVDLAIHPTELCAAIQGLRQNSTTAHIPILAFVERQKKQIQNAAREAGATIVASDAAMQTHLPELLAQVLNVD